MNEAISSILQKNPRYGTSAAANFWWRDERSIYKMYELRVIYLIVETCLNPLCILSLARILSICEILDLHLPLIDREIKSILRLIEIYENNRKEIELINPTKLSS
jgi:hypothetical protein